MEWAGSPFTARNPRIVLPLLPVTHLECLLVLIALKHFYHLHFETVSLIILLRSKPALPGFVASFDLSLSG